MSMLYSMVYYGYTGLGESLIAKKALKKSAFYDYNDDVDFIILL